MKKLVLLAIAGSLFTMYSCKKSTNNNTPVASVTDSMVINDFVSKVALPQYQTLQDKATALNTAVTALNATPTDANLAAAQQAWRDTRSSWEACEGFLFGPVEDNNYDPNMDTWPVDYLELDSLISSSTVFNVATVSALNQNLRGFHPLEYIIWGKGGNASAASLTSREKQYMVALAQDISNTCDSLNASWATSGGNFQQQVLTAGKGNTLFPTRRDALLAIANSMADICNEVGVQATDGKIFDAFSAHDSLLSESPFSHNSITDFRNNILGAQNVYLCTYNGQTGSSISSLVSVNNLSLDSKIKTQFAAALTALNSVTVNFEIAIYTQRTQLQAAMDALNTLHATLDDDLKTHIQTYVKD